MKRTNKSLVLTSLERRTLQMSVQGVSVDDMSDKLGLSTHSVVLITENIIEKLGGGNAFSAAVRAMHLGLIDE